MQHTYLRYECADSFSLTTSSSTTSLLTTSPLAFLRNSVNPKSSYLLSTSCSQIVGFNLKTCEPQLKIAHREALTGGVGTGRALNSDEALCIIVSSVSLSQEKSTQKVASGWKDGTVRVFDIQDEDLLPNQSQQKNKGRLGLVHSLIEEVESESETEFTMREPLVLNGHSESPVRCLAFDDRVNKSGEAGGVAGRLVSGGSDGTIILWDLIAETGLFRLLGHSGGITDLSFISPENDHGHLFNGLISSSLDGLVKVWDLEGQCCTQTITSHRGDVTCSATSDLSKSSKDTANLKNRHRLATGCNDGQVRIWSVSASKRKDMEETKELITESSQESKNNISSLDESCRFMGKLLYPPNVASSNEKIASLHFHPNGKYLGFVRHNSKNVDVYAIRSRGETERKKSRRLRRKREKEGKKTSSDTENLSRKRRFVLDDEEKEDPIDNEQLAKADYSCILDNDIKASDEFEYAGTIRCTHRVKSFSFSPHREGNHRIVIACALATNAIEMHSISRNKVRDDKEANEMDYVIKKVSAIDMYGHPTGIRSIALSYDDNLTCSVSKSVTKIWNVANRSCLGSFPLTSPNSKNSNKKSPAGTCYGLCVSFLPGDTHLIIGTREGHILILDIASGSIVFTEENAHDGAIWSLDVRRPSHHNKDEAITVVTGSADSSVKFWELEQQDIDEEDNFSNTGHPLVVHVRSLQTSDDVVAVKYSHSSDPSKRMVFVSTLDSQIKVFFDDTLKFFLSLYGHKLPALAFDASDDDTILASGGADKTIKIWGLDFGDTHRTLHGHSDSITDLKFVKNTHYFFTCSKDRTVRQWDADRFEQIVLLNGHASEVSCLAISRTGAFVLSGGMDRQVRVWERTQDIVFLDEEKERELEKLFDKVEDKGDETGTANIMRANITDKENDHVGDNADPQGEVAVRKSMLSISSGDRIMEAIEIADQEMKDVALFKKKQATVGKDETKRAVNHLLLGMDSSQYVHWILRSIKSVDLEQSLLVLPLSHVERLLFYLITLLKNGHGFEICSQVAIFLVKTHQSQIIANKAMSVPLRELKRLLKLRLTDARDIVGYNLAAMRITSKISSDHKKKFSLPEEASTLNVWSNIGLGSDEATALQRKSGGKSN